MRPQPGSHQRRGAPLRRAAATRRHGWGGARRWLVAIGAVALAAGLSPASSSAAGREVVVRTAYTTAYTWFDNTPHGSAEISHPVLHRKAGGTGTYADPLTIAVGHVYKDRAGRVAARSSTTRDVLDYPAGTRMYLPDVRRYAIVEDTCGDGRRPDLVPCHRGANANGSHATTWVDLWIGGAGGSRSAVQRCASTVTDGTGQRHTIVLNPAPDYVVASGQGVFHGGRCDAGYGNTLVRRR
jgi:hypothetical protein